MKTIYEGAEATLETGKYLDIPVVKKERKPKKYRIKEIDEKIKKERIKKEVKMLKKARKCIKTPYVLKTELRDFSITMEKVKGKTLKERMLKKKEEPLKLGKELGEILKKLHSQDIVHNDLTTSNMIREKGEIYLIDFGMAEKTHRTEDKAMDLLVFKKMLKSTHWKTMNKVWRNLKEKYSDKTVLDKMQEIEKRARYL